MDSGNEMQQTVEMIRQHCDSFVPDLAIILGSGLGHLREHIQALINISYVDLPLFPQSIVSGHQSELLVGELFGRKALLFCGRFHVYQGISSFDSTVPIRLAAALGCQSILLTCAVGGISEGIKPGDYMLVRDHLNFSGLNPLQGIEPPAFIDLQGCYTYDFFERLKTEAACVGRTLHSGVLAYMTGPSYETPAEIFALRTLGTSAVSMSTVPEAIMARALGLQVAALALVTNFAGGNLNEKLSHQEVLACSAAAAESLSHLVKTLLAEFIQD